MPSPTRYPRFRFAVLAAVPLAFAGVAIAAEDHDHDHDDDHDHGHEYAWPTPDPGHPDIPLTVHEHDGEKEIETLIPMWFSVSEASSFADRGGFIATASPGFPGFGAGEHDHGGDHGHDHDHDEDHGDEHDHGDHAHDHDHASFEPNTAISFRFKGTLSSWNGGGFVTEPTAAVQARNTSGPTDYWTQISGTGISPVGSDNTDGNDIYIGNTDSDGGLHAHVDWFLDNEPTDPTAFLMEIEVFANGYETSDPLPVLFNFGMDEEGFESAVNTAAAIYNIPEPGTAMLMGLGLTAVLVGRRRRT